jgi:hypothetical protein
LERGRIIEKGLAPLSAGYSLYITGRLRGVKPLFLSSPLSNKEIIRAQMTNLVERGVKGGE